MADAPNPKHIDFLKAIAHMIAQRLFAEREVVRPRPDTATVNPRPRPDHAPRKSLIKGAAR